MNSLRICLYAAILPSVLLTALSKDVYASNDDIVAAQPTTQLEVYKSPTCGCCSGWIEHIKAHGLASRAHHPTDLTQVKNSIGIPANARSCHTAVSSNGYSFEGHIPAKFITQFLANPPSDAKGLIVPGMPVGSPGMEYNNQFRAYTILQLNQDGTLAPYAQVDTLAQQY